MPKSLSILRVLFALALMGGLAAAQTVLMPMPRQCFQDVLSSGKPLAGGKIFTYQAGTSTPQATFTDATGLVANTNPVILDAAGCWTIWLTSGQAYRFVAQNSFGVQEWVTDQVSGLATVGSAFNQAITTVTFGATPTFTATGQFQVFKMTLTGNVTSSTLSMTGITAPSLVTFELTQDGTGGRTFTFPLNTVGGAPLNPASNSVTNQTFFWDGTTAWATDSLVSKTLLTPTITNPSINGVSITTPLNLPVVQFKNGVLQTHTGDMTQDTIYTVSLPALSANSHIRICMWIAIAAQGAGTTNLKVFISGTVAYTASITSAVWAASNLEELWIVNRGATNSQVSTESHQALTSIFQVNGGLNTSSIDTSVPTSMTITVTNANNSDSQQFNWITVEELP